MQLREREEKRGGEAGQTLDCRWKEREREEIMR